MTHPLRSLPPSTNAWSCRWFITIAVTSSAALVAAAATDVLWAAASSSFLLGLVLGMRQRTGATC